jgi:5-methylcytosine-specific restriction endonuclease McrA
MSYKYCSNGSFCSPDAHWEFSHFFINYEGVFSERWNCIECGGNIELPAPMKYFEHWVAKKELENLFDSNHGVVSTLEDCSWATQTGCNQLTKDFKRPSIQQYKKEVEPSQCDRMTPALRSAILERDKFTCCDCGRNAYDSVKVDVAYIVPVSKGGKTIKSNLQALCEECNLAKRDKLIKNP